MKRIAVFGFLSVVIILWAACQKELSQESNVNNAIFGFHDTSKVCFPVETNGTYYNGVSAARDTNFITVVVNITKTGDYNITTDSSNGFYFSASGFFSKTGLDTIVLKAGGRPILEQQTPFTFPSDSLGSCGFSIDVKDSTGTGLGGVDTSGSGTGGTAGNGNSSSYTDPNPASTDTWHFTDNTNNKTFTGPMLNPLLQSNFGLNVLSGNGTVKNNTNEVFSFVINLPSATIAPGSYPADGVTASLFLANVSNSSFDYSADGTAPEEATDPSSINITSYDASSKRLKISFRCWAVDANGKSALIEGSLNAKVQ